MSDLRVKKRVKKRSKGVERNILFLFEVQPINTVANEEAIKDDN